MKEKIAMHNPMENEIVTDAATASVDQMNLTFAGRRPAARANAKTTRRQRRLQRAQWWFAQMRRVVDHAKAWQPAPPARHEQVYLTLATRRNW
jgi:hypothetical protein